MTKNKNQELRVELQSLYGIETYAQYSTFNVGNEGSKYRLAVSGYSGTAGVSLIYPHNGMKFTTRDDDNDNWSGGKCAVSNHGACWYNGCHQSNLNGEYAKSAVTGSRFPIWYDWKRYEALRKTLLMIRLKN